MHTNGEMPLVIMRDANKLRKKKRTNKQFCGSTSKMHYITTVVQRKAWMYILILNCLLLLILALKF